jgi:hypothetical protein
LPVCIFREDAADDLGFNRVDLSFAGRGGDEVIDVGRAARDLALQRSPKLAAPGLLLEVREVKLRQVPSMPMCIAVISPTLTAIRVMPAKVQQSYRSAMSERTDLGRRGIFVRRGSR